MFARISLLVIIAAILCGCAVPVNGNLPVTVSQTIVSEDPGDAPTTWVTELGDGSLLVQWNGELGPGESWYVFEMTMNFLDEGGAKAMEAGWWLTEANSLRFNPEKAFDVYAWIVVKVVPSGFKPDGLILTALTKEGKGDTLK